MSSDLAKKLAEKRKGATSGGIPIQGTLPPPPIPPPSVPAVLAPHPSSSYSSSAVEEHKDEEEKLTEILAAEFEENDPQTDESTLNIAVSDAPVEQAPENNLVVDISSASRDHSSAPPAAAPGDDGDEFSNNSFQISVEMANGDLFSELFSSQDVILSLHITYGGDYKESNGNVVGASMWTFQCSNISPSDLDDELVVKKKKLLIKLPNRKEEPRSESATSSESEHQFTVSFRMADHSIPIPGTIAVNDFIKAVNLQSECNLIIVDCNDRMQWTFRCENQEELDKLDCDDITVKKVKLVRVRAEKIKEASSLIIDDLPPSQPELARVESQKLWESYSNSFCETKTMPICAEKCIALLYNHCMFEQMKRDGAKQLLSLEEVDEQLKLLQKLLSEEDLLNSATENSLRKIISFLKGGHLEFAGNELWKLLREIQPLQMGMLLSYLSRMEKAAKLINGMDIILLIGMTGVGKSTTIQFLAGSKFQRTEIANLKHIAVVESALPELESFTTSPFSKSETKTINAIRVPYKNGFIYLCDSPGLGDTSGTEFDLANGISLAKSLQNCRSVKILVLLSHANIGDKAEGLSKMSDALIKFISSTEKYLPSISYIFTKLPKEDSSKICPIIRDKLRNLNSDQKMKGSLQALLKDIIAKTANGALILDPLTDSRDVILEQILNSPAIMNPMDVFKEFAATGSSEILKLQFSKHRNCIQNAMKTEKFELIKYKIEQLQLLNRAINLVDSNQVLVDSLQDLFRYMQSLVDDVFSSINACASGNSGNIEQIIDRTCALTQKLVGFESLRQQFYDEDMNLDVENVNILDSCLNLFRRFESNLFNNIMSGLFDPIKVDKQLGNLYSKFKQLTTFAKIVKNYPHLSVLSAEFDELIDKVRREVSAFVEFHRTNVQAALQTSSYQKIVQGLNCLKEAGDSFGTHETFKSIPMKSYYQDTVQMFLDNISGSVMNAIAIIEQRRSQMTDKLQEQHILLIHDVVITIVEVLDLDGISEHIPLDRIESLNIQLLNYCISYVATCYVELQNIKQAFLKKMYVLLKEVEALLALEIIRIRTTKEYLSIVEFISSFIANYKDRAFVDFNNILTGSTSNEKEFSEDVMRLYNAKFYFSSNSLVYHSEFEKIQLKVVEFLEDCRKIVTEFIFDLQNVDFVINFFECYKKIELFVKSFTQAGKLESQDLSSGRLIIDEVATCSYVICLGQQILELFSSKIMKGLKIIQSLFDDLGTSQNLLKSHTDKSIHTEIKLSLSFLQICKQYGDMFKVGSQEATIDDTARRHFLEIHTKIDTAFKNLDFDSYPDKESEINYLRCIFAYVTRFVKVSKGDNDIFEELFVRPSKQILDTWCGHNSYLWTSFTNMAADLSNAEKSSAWDLGRLQTDWVKVKMYSKLDEFLDASESEKFSILAHQYEMKIRQLNDGILMDIKLGRYERVQEELDKLDPAKPETKDQRYSIVNELEVSFSAASQDLKQKVESFQVDVHSNIILNEIWCSLSYLFKYVYILGSYINSTYTSTNCALILSLAESIYASAITFSNQMDSTLEAQNFAAFEQLFISLEYFLSLERFSDVSRNRQQLSSILELKRQACLNRIEEIINYYSTFEVQLLNKLPPVHVIEKFKAAIPLNNAYSKYLSDFTSSIDGHINNLFDRLRETTTSDNAGNGNFTIDESENILTVLESSAACLPIETMTKFAPVISECKAKMSDIKKYNEMCLENAAQSQDIKAIIAQFEGYCNKGEFQLMESARKAVFKRFQALDNKYKDDMKDGNLILVLQGLPYVWEEWACFSIFVAEGIKLNRSTRHQQIFRDCQCLDLCIGLLKAVVKKYSETLSAIENFNFETCKSIKFVDDHFLELNSFLSLKHVVLNGIPSTLFMEIAALDKNSRIEDRTKCCLNFIVSWFENWQGKIKSFLKVVPKDPTTYTDVDSMADIIKVTLASLSNYCAGDSLLAKLIEICTTNNIASKELSEIAPKVKELKVYQQLKIDVSRKVHEWIEFCMQSYLHNEKTTTPNGGDRDEFYKTLSKVYQVTTKFLKQFAAHIDESICTVTGIDITCKTHFANQIDAIKKEVKEYISKFPTPNVELYKSFNICFDNLRSIQAVVEDQEIRSIATSAFDQMSVSFNTMVEEVKKKAWLTDSQFSNAYQLIDQVIDNLLSLKEMTCVTHFKKQIERIIDNLLADYKSRPEGAQFIGQIGVSLNMNKYKGAVSQMLISEHSAFQGYALSLRNKKTQTFTIGQVLSTLEGDGINTACIEKLDFFYNCFDSEYWKIVEIGLSKSDAAEGKGPSEFQVYLNGIISDANFIADGEKSSYDEKIRKLMANVFAVWTLSNSKFYREANDPTQVNKKAYLLQPHAAQIVSIFRLFGIDSGGSYKKDDSQIDSSKVQKKKKKGFGKIGNMINNMFDKNSGKSSAKFHPIDIQNHFVQIGTGEGKSVTLAISSIILAILGYQVDCACYSEYLSKRDFESFKDLFNAFALGNKIRYGTFNLLCENFLNAHGDIRALVNGVVTGDVASRSSLKVSGEMHRVLLIDEVDVFFNEDFYGNVYKPMCKLHSPEIEALVNHIWANRNNPSMLSFRKIQNVNEYKRCVQKYKDWDFIFENAVKRMLLDLKTFKTHDYHVDDKKCRIGYFEHDKISYNRIQGYKTMFAYFEEHERPNSCITLSVVNQNTFIFVDCGSFSYGEVPHMYELIIGVSGTLKTLTDEQRTLLRVDYEVEKFTYTPSVYGQNKLAFSPDSSSDCIIENITGYYTAIVNEIQHRLVGSQCERAVLVFFETTKKMNDFFDSDAFRTYRNSARKMTEGMTLDEREVCVRQAVTSRSVTLMGREFGRGTDFICYDEKLNASGGVHVLQTFVSEEVSEETQIKGRTARQGNKGSFSFVLLDSELEKFSIDETAIDQMNKQGSRYTTICKHRTDFFQRKYPETLKYVEEIKKDHYESQSFLNSLLQQNIPALRAFLVDRNTFAGYVEDTFEISRTICLMDATGSMSDTLDKSKRTVKTMFERAFTVLKEQNLSNAFQLQFAVYRNYSSKKEKLLQYSGWESDPDSLKAFMDPIRVDGGQGNEAIEIGLWHVNDEIRQGNKVTQVILIGDMPPNTEQNVESNRSGSGGQAYWSQTPYAQKTYYADELQKLIAHGVPVHCYYVKPSAATKFGEIASLSKGQCGALDIESPKGADMLTKLVTENVLQNIGDVSGNAALGNKLVECYRQKFDIFHG